MGGKTADTLGSPVAWAGDYHLIDHTAGCPVRDVAIEISKMNDSQDMSRLTKLLNDKAPGTSLPSHTRRLVCQCMVPMEFDRQICLELMSRDLCIEAYSQLMKMSTVYPLQQLMKDKDLRLIAMNYMTIKQLYTLLSQDATLTPKAIKSGMVYEKTKLDLPKISADTLSDSVFHHGQVGMYGSLFDDIIAGRGHPTKIPDSLPELYTVAWKAALSEEDIQVWYRMYPGGIDFRVEGIIPSSIHDIISICSEVEMAKLWMPSVKVPKIGLSEAKCIKRTGRFTKVSLYRVQLPYPLTNVEVVVQGSLTDDLERNNTLTVVMSSFDKNASHAEKETWPIEEPPVAKGHDRIQFGGGCVFMPKSEKEVSMRTLWTIKMDDTPNARLVDFVSSKFLKIAFGKFIGTVQKFRETFAEAQKDDPWLYGHLENRMAELAELGIGVSKSTKGVQGKGFQNARQNSVYMPGHKFEKDTTKSQAMAVIPESRENQSVERMAVPSHDGQEHAKMKRRKKRRNS